MTARLDGPVLWVRAAVLSGLALTTGAAAHVQAEGLLPGTGTLVVLAVVGTLACAPLLRRPGSLPRVAALMVAGQSAVHVVLSATAGHRGEAAAVVPATTAAPVPPTGDRTGSYFDVAYAATSPASVGDASGPVLPEALTHALGHAAAHPLMALAHVLAAVVCAWWLVLGDRALARLLELAARSAVEVLGPVLARWARVPAVAVGLPAVAGPAYALVTPPPATPLLGRSSSRRGPPAARARA